ncbi:DUF3418 domain-containing protein [Corynebacterium aquatimens]
MLHDGSYRTESAGFAGGAGAAASDGRGEGSAGGAGAAASDGGAAGGGALDSAKLAFPDSWRQGTIDYELQYKFEPGDPFDGVTVMVPVPLLAGLKDDGFDWLVPGLRLELFTELIRTLPKALRKTVVPAPDYAARALAKAVPGQGRVVEQLAHILQSMGGHGIAAADFRPEAVPGHLRMTFAAVDRRGKITDHDKDLQALKTRRAGQIHSSVAKAGKRSETDVVREWTVDTLGDVPETVTTTIEGNKVDAYPALEAAAGGVRVKVFPTKAAADASMVTATLTLLLRRIDVSTQQMLKGLPLRQRVAVEHYPHGGAAGLVEDARVAAIRDALFAAGGPVRRPAEFEELVKTIKPTISGAVRRTIVSIAPGLVEYSNLAAELDNWHGPAIDDINRQMAFLLPKHAITIHGMEHLQHLPRYVQAIRVRLEDMALDPDRDAERQATIDAAREYLDVRLRRLPKGREKSRAVKDILWRIEELRVSVFAQRLGTAKPVSQRRIEKMVDKLS